MTAAADGVQVRLRRGALAALREGRVTVLASHSPIGRAGRRRPSGVLAEVDGHSGRHLVELDAGSWSCSCATVGLCAHVVAVRLVSRDVADLAAVAERER